jgi:hypothetical protein
MPYSDTFLDTFAANSAHDSYQQRATRATQTVDKTAHKKGTSAAVFARDVRQRRVDAVHILFDSGNQSSKKQDQPTQEPERQWRVDPAAESGKGFST